MKSCCDCVMYTDNLHVFFEFSIIVFNSRLSICFDRCIDRCFCGSASPVTAFAPARTDWFDYSVRVAGCVDAALITTHRRRRCYHPLKRSCLGGAGLRLAVGDNHERRRNNTDHMAREQQHNGACEVGDKGALERMLWQHVDVAQKPHAAPKVDSAKSQHTQIHSLKRPQTEASTPRRRRRVCARTWARGQNGLSNCGSQQSQKADGHAHPSGERGWIHGRRGGVPIRGGNQNLIHEHPSTTPIHDLRLN